jgi:PAS domain S-box-containing protein
MNLYALISFFSSIVCLIVGVVVYERDMKSPTNRVFLLLCLGISYSIFVQFGYFQARGFDEAWVWWKLDALRSVALGFLLHFVLLFTENEALLKKRWPYLLIYGPIPCIVGLQLTTELISGPPVAEPWGWRFSIPPHNPVGDLTFIWYLGVNLFGIGLVAHYYGRVQEARKRSQARLFLMGMGLAVLASICESVLPLMGTKIPGITAVVLPITASLIGYAIWKHRLFTLSPVTAAEKIVSLMTDGLILVDEAGEIISVNEGAAGLLGYRKRELTGRHLDRLFPAETGRPSWITRVLDRREGTPRAIHDLQMQFVTRGNKRVPISLSGTVVESEATGVRGLLLIARDITRRKRSEAERGELEEQLKQVQKMDAIGRLAGGVAHDMNNVLGAIMGAVSVVDLELDEDSAARDDVLTIIYACQRGRELTQNLLGFARKGKYVKKRVSLNAVVREIEALLGRTVSKKISIQTGLGRHIPDIKGDASQLEQILMNVCINAVDAMRGLGILTIETRELDTEEEEPTHRSGLIPGRYVELKVTDTGEGIDKRILPHVFEPFFTTKAKGQGSGLGLSMAYGAVQNHGGLIRVSSASAKGTEVVILLPSIETEVEDDTAGTRHSEPGLASPAEAFRSRDILLVEDDALIRNTAKRLLEKLGHRVLVAENGQEAVSVFMEEPARVGLVILDLFMPEMDGYEAFWALRKIDREVRVLLCSGYKRDARSDELIAAGAVGFLQKPFDFQSLAGEVEKAFR